MSSPLSLTVVLNGGEQVLPLPPIEKTIDVGTIKVIIGSELNLSPGSLVLLYKQVVLTDGQTLGSIGIGNDEILEARVGRVPTAATGSGVATAARPAASPSAAVRSPVTGSGASRSSNSLGIPDAILHDAAQVRNFIRSNQQLLFGIEASNPPLAQAIMMNDIEPFRRMWSQIVAHLEEQRLAEEERLALENADPMDPAVQARIAEEIRLKNVQENYELAIEHNPEAFGRVVMLYVPMSVNGVGVQAFVDSGAQSTIMNVQCAERCGIMRLIDRRFSGVAKGVGSAKILGRVHQVPVKIGSVHLSMSFTILDNPDMDFLLGLDQLKNHQACIDLAKNALIIQGQEIPFLAEKDLPAAARGAPELNGDHAMSGPSASAPPVVTDKTGGATSSSSSASATPSSAVSSHNQLHPPPAAAAASASGSHTSSTHAQSSAAAAAVAAAQRRIEAAQSQSQSQSTPAAASTSATSTSTTIATPSQPNVTTSAGPIDPLTQSIGPNSNPNPASIGQLTDLGFSYAESVAALQQFGGNVDAAASFLFSS